ncbi:MAG: aspartyl protease family protein [Alphaproteobacteria bacterium]|nr:aspartyl protease family protein [Alphaproteobacteria bacterium]
MAGAAQAATERCDIGKLAELPVTMDGLRPHVTVKINGVDAIFIADSGAFYSFIDRETVRRLKLGSDMTPIGFSVSGVSGSDSRVDVTTVRSFGLGGITIPNVRFLAMPGVGFGSSGLLGQNVLSVFDTEYDLGNGMIRLMKPSDGCRRARVAYWAGPRPVGIVDMDTITPQHSQLRGNAKLNGRSIKVLFDTGSPVSYVKESTARRLGFRPEGPGVQAGGSTGGIGSRRMETWIAPFDELDIGGEKILHTRLRVADIELNDADMLLGADFFLSHRVYVSKQQRRLFFTYNGGPVFQLGEPPVVSAVAAEPAQALADPYADAPTDAAGFARRGDASMARRDFGAALADFTKASELEPKNAAHFVRRAQAHMALHQPVLAMADFDHALSLKPDDVAARIGRGRLYLAGGDLTRTKADFDAAIAAKPDLALPIAVLYTDAARFEPAIALYDGWIAANPGSATLYSALNGRCWARSLWGHELDKAIADCQAAVRRGPHIAALFDSRGMAHLRRGEFDLAIADYNEALKLQPKLA